MRRDKPQQNNSPSTASYNLKHLYFNYIINTHIKIFSNPPTKGVVMKVVKKIIIILVLMILIALNQGLMVEGLKTILNATITTTTIAAVAAIIIAADNSLIAILTTQPFEDGIEAKYFLIIWLIATIINISISWEGVTGEQTKNLGLFVLVIATCLRGISWHLLLRRKNIK